MQLTRHTDYALRVLMFLGARSGASATVAEIAKFYRISHHHLTKVVQRLVEAGFVAARRGRGGGVTLARPPEDINLADVVRRLETELHLVECQRGKARCRIQGPCSLQGIMDDALASFLDELEKHSLADVLPSMGTHIPPTMLSRARRGAIGSLAPRPEARGRASS